MEISRRTFMQAGAMLAATAPTVRPAPSDRITVGMIGTGARGQELMVKEVSFLGSMARYIVETETGDRIQVDEHNPKRFRKKGAPAYLLLDEEGLHLQKIS